MKWETIVEQKVKKFIEKDEGRLKSHGFDHIKRVQKYALMLAEKEGGDKEIITLAALLHDIKTSGGGNKYSGRLLPSGIHGAICAVHAKKLLQSINYPKSTGRIICSIIKEHEWSIHKNRSIESQILYEADKIDAFGALGVLRHLYFLAELGIPFTCKLDLKRLDIVEKSFKTKTGKNLLRPKMRAYKKIFRQAQEEIK
jgi:uncharacterized protein